MKIDLPIIPEGLPAKRIEDYKVPDDPKNPPFNGKIIGKRAFWFLTITSILFFLGIITMLIWFNMSVKDGMFLGNTTVINNVDTPDIPVTIDDKDTNNYDHTINNNIEIDIPKSEREELGDYIIDGVLEGLNETG